MKVSQLMSRAPVVVQKSASLDTAMALMEEHDIRHLPVLDGSSLVGILSDRDLLDATGWLPPRERAVLEVPEGPVGAFMRHPPVVVEQGLDLVHALRLIARLRIGSLPVVDRGRLVGILTEMDFLRAYVDACRTGIVSGQDDSELRRHMTADPTTIACDASGDEALALLTRTGVRHLPVLDGERLVGILSDRDLRRFRGQGALELTLVHEMMTPEPRSAAPDKGLSHAAHILSTHRISALPIVEHGKLAGILTLIDVLTPCATILMERAHQGNP